MSREDGRRVFTVRLDPKTSFGVDFFSTQLRYRTGAKLIEEAIDIKLTQIPIEVMGSEGSVVSMSAIEILDRIWHPDPVDRFLNIAFDYPELLKNDEIYARIWSLLSEIEILWLGGEFKQRADKTEVYVYETKLDNLDLRTFRRHWDDFRAWADEETPDEDKRSREELERLIYQSVKQDS